MTTRRGRMGWTFLVLGAVAGCGGETASPNPPPPPPPPAPVVTTVVVSPVSGPLFMTDTLQLTATVKDQRGAEMSGKIVAWTSSNPALATVDATGRVIGVAAGSVTVTAAVEGKSGSVTLTIADPGPRVTVEATTAASKTIGSSGGSLTTISSAGIQYTLSVPSRALATPTLITLTPVTGIRKLPLTGGIAGAVELQPAGLKFAVPALLRISAFAARPSGLRLVGFSYTAQADALAPAALADSGSSLTVLVPHFSGAGAAFGTSLQVQGFLTTSQSNNQSSQLYLNQLIGLAGQTPRDFNAELQVMRDWMANVVVPSFQNAQNDFGLVLAMGEYNFWLETPILYAITGASNVLAPQRAAAAAAAAPKLRAAIAGNNQLCITDQDLAGASNVLFWQTQAAALAIDTPAEQLDRRTVLDQLCVQVIITRADFPDPAPPGQTHTFDARAGLKFGSSPVLNLAQLSWQVDITGSTQDGSQTGLADAFGQFVLSVTPAGPQPLSIVVTMCLFSASVPYADVCGGQVIVRTQPLLLPVITTTALQPNYVGGSYGGITLQATGGVGGFQWSVSSGALPPGLSLSTAGSFGGTSTAAGTFAFTVQVASGTQTAQRSFTLRVLPAAATCSSPVGDDAVILNQDSVQVFAGVAELKGFIKFNDGGAITMPNLVCVTGVVFVSGGGGGIVPGRGPALSSVDLPGLRVGGRGIEIGNSVSNLNPALQRVTMTSLQSIDGFIRVYKSPVLSTLRFPALNRWVDGVELVDDPQLTTVELGPTVLGSLFIQRTGLTTLSGFASGMMVVGGGINLLDNPGLCLAEINAFLARITVFGNVVHNATC